MEIYLGNKNDLESFAYRVLRTGVNRALFEEFKQWCSDLDLKYSFKYKCSLEFVLADRDGWYITIDGTDEDIVAFKLAWM